MSDIKFLISDFKEEDKKELNDIGNQLDLKPFKHHKETLFLKKFVLSMMKQYYQPRHKEISKLQTKIDIAMPDIRHIIPHIMPKPPGRLDIGEFMPRSPLKLDLFGEIASPRKEVGLKIEELKIHPKIEVPNPIEHNDPPKPPRKEIEVPKPF